MAEDEIRKPPTLRVGLAVGEPIKDTRMSFASGGFCSSTGALSRGMMTFLAPGVKPPAQGSRHNRAQRRADAVACLILA